MIYLFLLVAGFSVLSFFLLINSTSEILKATELRLKHTSEMVQLKLQERIKELNEDIHYISASPLVKDYINEESDVFKEKLEEEYIAILNAKSDYDQVRLIVGEEGKEVVRAERMGYRVGKVAEDQMQEKGDRDYYLATKQLKEGEIYLSSIDLNKEFGKISLPKTPTIRAASPLFKEGQFYGVVIINLNLSNLYHSLDKIVMSPLKMRFINEDGFYIYHEDDKRTFQFELSDSAEKDVVLRDTRYNSIIDESGNLVLINTVELPGTNYELNLEILALKKDVLASYSSWRNRSFIILGVISLLFVALAFYFIRRQTEKLANITDKLKSFPKEMKITNLPKSKDEIGALSEGFEEMAEIINKQVQSLESAKKIAEDAMDDKQRFIENVSHEIRNPLQSITGITETLKQNLKGKGQIDLLKSLEFNTNNLISLVNDVLDYDEVSSGNIKLDPEWINLQDYVERLYKSNKYQALINKVKFFYKIRDEVDDIEIFVDEVRLNQVLNNLISNAIKFTPEKGEVLLSVGIIKGQITFWVMDNGIGISKDSINTITNRYFQGDHKTLRKLGKGIGLNIVQGILDAMDSKLRVESNIDEGTIMSFKLNLNIRKVEENKEVEISSYSSLPADYKLLIFEDDPQISDLYRHIFSPAHIEIYSDFREDLKMDNYDVIITDCKLNKTNIQEFATFLKENKRDKVLLYVSATPFEQLGKELNIFDEYFMKPFSSQKLIMTIIKAMNRKRFGLPDFSDIKKDYDFDQGKYIKAIALLKQQWEEARVELQRAKEPIDIERIDNIRHKIITTARRLNLNLFEELLYPENDNDIIQNLDCIDEAMQFYLEEVDTFLNLEQEISSE